MTFQQVADASRMITEELLAWDIVRKAQVCMAFLSMSDEPQMDDIIQYLLETGKTVCVPRPGAEFGMMDAAVIDSLNNVKKGRLGIRTPDTGCPAIDPQLIDLILVPGVAFDRAGTRLGMGAGYYDRYLRGSSGAILAGVAWSFQIVQVLPQERHDIPVQWLVTEDGIYDCIQGKI